MAKLNGEEKKENQVSKNTVLGLFVGLMVLIGMLGNTPGEDWLSFIGDFFVALLFGGYIVIAFIWVIAKVN